MNKLNLTGQVKEQVLRKADKDFERWVRQAFQESSKDFSFTLALQDQSTESTDTSMQTHSHLVWKKVDGKFKIRLAQIPLTPVNFNKAHSKIFDTAIDQIQQSDIKIREMQEKQNSLMNDVQDYRNKMTEIRDCKAVLEEELFSAFLPILNSKQDEIRKLKRKVSRNWKIITLFSLLNCKNSTPSIVYVYPLNISKADLSIANYFRLVNSPVLKMILLMTSH